MNKTVLVIGSGGREHALAWKLSQSPRVARVICAPGNDGFPAEWERWKVALSQGNLAFQALAAKALEEKVDLVVVGPDNALADGIVDVFEAHGVKIFGPSRAAARIEASKGFAKEVMQAAGVPTARYQRVKSAEEAKQFLESVPWNRGWVIKADGLALGKGVRVCESLPEALEASRTLIQVSGELVIEERLFGEELSWLAFCDGEHCALLEPARDHKRLKDGDQGPNTGGMGAFSPVPHLPGGAELAHRVRSQVFIPTLREMKRRGTPFRGVLYAGLMVNPEGFWVIEFNARFGDPETQVLLPRMSDDLYLWCDAVAHGDISTLPPDVGFSAGSAVVVVGAAAGYPDSPEKGQKISGGLAGGLEQPAGFWAGVEKKDGQLVTAGGRVFGALGMGGALETARREAYKHLSEVSFQGMQFRSDIAKSGASI